MDPSADLIHYRRLALGLTQLELARALGVTPGMAAHLDTGRREAGDVLLPKLEAIIAFGSRDPRDARPVYVLAAMVDGEPAFLHDERQRFGYFVNRGLATVTAELLRRGGLSEITAAPAWPSFVAALRTVAALGSPGGGVHHVGAVVSARSAGDQEAVEREEARLLMRRIFEWVASALATEAVAA